MVQLLYLGTLRNYGYINNTYTRLGPKHIMDGKRLLITQNPQKTYREIMTAEVEECSTLAHASNC